MKNMTTGQIRQLLEIDASQGIFGAMQRIIRELTRKPDDKPEPRIFDEEGFELVKLDYSPDLATVKAECGLGWNNYLSEENFKRRVFEQGVGEVQTKLHAPKRQIWSVEAMLELEDMACSGATIREGVAWALTHDVNDYPKDIVIALLGSARRYSVGNLYVPCLCRDDGRWYVHCSWGGYDRWDAHVLFLAVRRKF